MAATTTVGTLAWPRCPSVNAYVVPNLSFKFGMKHEVLANGQRGYYAVVRVQDVDTTTFAHKVIGTVLRAYPYIIEDPRKWKSIESMETIHTIVYEVMRVLAGAMMNRVGLGEGTASIIACNYDRILLGGKSRAS